MTQPNRDRKKHCDKCSYMTEEGLAVSGCAYCGCHSDNPMTQPIQKEWGEEIATIIDKHWFSDSRDSITGDYLLYSEIRSFIESLLSHQAQAICERVEGMKEKEEEFYLNHSETFPPYREGLFKGFNHALSQVQEMIRKDYL